MLTLDDRPAFELSFWCGTCQFLFQRMEGANESLSLEEMRSQLSRGLDDIDSSVVEAFGGLLPEGHYMPMLLSVLPRLVVPGKAGDYFGEEQLATWGVDSFWGLPEYPRTAYYRTFETPVAGRDSHLFEFIVPMVPPAWDDAETVRAQVERLLVSDAPTAVAISTLDVCQPAMDTRSVDYYGHWCLTHFLLDGHHKMHAAADAGRPLRLLSLLSVDGSLATAEQVATALEVRARQAAART
ncbi:MAG TPA: hypothetical protein PKB06_03855 [Actinotalea sp.]|nr:hypothetical protein [Actinotalea sp.]